MKDIVHIPLVVRPTDFTRAQIGGEGGLVDMRIEGGLQGRAYSTRELEADQRDAVEARNETTDFGEAPKGKREARKRVGARRGRRIRGRRLGSLGGHEDVQDGHEVSVIPDANLAEGHASSTVTWRDGTHVKDRAEVVNPDVMEAHSKEVSGELDERDVGPCLRLEDELLPGLDSPRLAL